MILAEMTWQEVEALDREIVVLIPTGSLEQHGPHLPLFTDTILATAVASAVEKRIPQSVLLTPTLWLGASAHHLPFPGSLSNSFDAYTGAIESVVNSLMPHGFHKFWIINGHGGNDEPNGIVLRDLKHRHPNVTFGHRGYFEYVTSFDMLEGPLKGIAHACEAEASLMMHVRPELVRKDKFRDDGLKPEPEIKGLVHNFDDITEQGSFGYATLASAEKGRMLFEAAVEGASRDMEALAKGYVLRGL